MNEYQYPHSERPEITPFLPEQYFTVLEIGCGLGGFRTSLKSDIELWGIEPNQYAAQQAGLKGYKVLVGLYDDVELQCPDDHFDLIVCNDVIEHMVDHEKFLIAIKKKMRPDACIVGSIPNIRHFPILLKLVFEKDWHYTETGVLDRTHLRFFTEKSLKRAFENCGYTIEKLAGINITEKYWFTVRSLIKYLLIHCTFGFFSDIRYVQFGFRIRV